MMEIGSRAFCNLCTQVVVPTKLVRQELRKYGFRKSIDVIAGGINVKKFKNSEKGSLRKRFHIPDDNLVVLYVGRLGKEKNIEFILESFSVLKNKEKVTLVIVGDGPERDKLTELSDRLGIGEQTIFTGFIPTDEVGKAYVDADVFVFSSKTETQGLVVAEAMAAALAVLVVSDGAFKEIVQHNETGLVAKDNLLSFSKNLENLIANPELRTRLGKQAQEHVEKYYSSPAQAEKLIKVYKKALRLKKEKLRERGVFKKSLLSLADFFRMTESFNRFKSIMRFVNGNYN
jgi:glycosyltransferase involved in cell wall biosynthesis